MIFKTLKFLSYNQLLNFKVLVDMCGIDYPEKKNRFEIVYNLLSLTTNFRLTVTTSVREGISIQSVTSIFNSAN
jgi:NADH-quinone oxidoreductase subunit C